LKNGLNTSPSDLVCVQASFLEVGLNKTRSVTAINLPFAARLAVQTMAGAFARGPGDMGVGMIFSRGKKNNFFC